MKQLALILALCASIGLAHAAPQEAPLKHDMAEHVSSSHDTPPHVLTYQGVGVVKAIKNGKLQIAHQAIPALQWPAMTMWFSISEHADHDIQVGDTVHFELMQGDKNQWAIIAIKRR